METPTREQILAALSLEEQALASLLPAISDEDWSSLTRGDGWTIHELVGHIVDSVAGITRMVVKGPPPGDFDLHSFNASRRAKNQGRTRADLMERLPAAFAEARAAVEQHPDLGAPGPYGPERSAGVWLAHIASHSAEHRGEIEAALAR